MAAWQDLPMGKPSGVLVAKQPDALDACQQQVAFLGEIRVS